MSRKARMEKRQDRRKQQRQYLIAGGIVAVLVIAAVVIVIAATISRQNAEANAQATGTAEVLAAYPPTPAPPEASAIETLVADAEAMVDEDAEPEIRSEAETARWDEPPPLTIAPETTRYLATLVTEKGPVVVQLFAQHAPVTVNNFIFLAREGYYDNTSFHRVIDGFMAQAGDPTGTGAGGPGYQFADEVDTGLTFDRAGLLAMANAGPGTNGSQFFITYTATPNLNGRHTIFGEVVEGMDIVQSLTKRDPQKGPDYLGDTLIAVEITELPAE